MHKLLITLGLLLIDNISIAQTIKIPREVNMNVKFNEKTDAIDFKTYAGPITLGYIQNTPNQEGFNGGIKLASKIASFDFIFNNIAGKYKEFESFNINLYKGLFSINNTILDGKVITNFSSTYNTKNCQVIFKGLVSGEDFTSSELNLKLKY